MEILVLYLHDILYYIYCIYIYIYIIYICIYKYISHLCNYQTTNPISNIYQNIKPTIRKLLEWKQTVVHKSCPSLHHFLQSIYERWIINARNLNQSLTQTLFNN